MQVAEYILIIIIISKIIMFTSDKNIAHRFTSNAKLRY